jgi:hypothetical protein
MGLLTIIAPYIPQIIKMVNGAIKGDNKGKNKMDAAADIAETLLKSIDGGGKFDKDNIQVAIQAVFDQMKASGEVDGPKEISNEKYYIIRASRIQEI